MVRRSPRFRVFFAFLILLAVAFAAHSVWLRWLALPLIKEDGPAKADVAVVLGGDFNGLRIAKAASLVRDGFVPRVLVSGPALFDSFECDLAIDAAVHRGYPREWFIPVPHHALSTREEVGVIAPALRQIHARSFLLVTSDYHSARAGRLFRGLFRKVDPGLSIRVVAAPDKYFTAEGWWRSREGQKVFFFEWCKSFATAVGM